MAYNAKNFIYLNQNPLDITDEKWYAWFSFYTWETNNTQLSSSYQTNTNIGKSLSQQYIDEYNQLNSTNPSYQISPNSITAVQTFNSKSDSDVVVDGWLGTQTAKLIYPRLDVFVLTNSALKKLNQPRLINSQLKDDEPYWNVSDIYAPVFWGNKRYLLDYKTIHNNWQSNKNTDWRKATIPYNRLKYYDNNKNLINDQFNEQLKVWNGAPYTRYNPLTLKEEPVNFNWEDPYYTTPQPPKPANFAVSSTVEVKKSKDPTTATKQNNNKTLMNQTGLTTNITNPK